MLLVPGASGTGDAFRGLAEHLASDYTVLTYDRRGFGRSELLGPQEYEHRLSTDADDARCLVVGLSGEPATLFGASSGGIVVLEVLARFPSIVATLVPFEPPVVRMLPDGQTWLDIFAHVYELYREAGAAPAMERFREQAFAEPDRQIMARAMDPSNPVALANATYWLEHELRQYPAVQPQIQALRHYADRILPAVGRESRDTPAHAATFALARALGDPVVQLPGAHLGCVAYPAAFARELVEALKERTWPQGV
jgi:pimeloyl-ACP methyl ester carboxylesterase